MGGFYLPDMSPCTLEVDLALRDVPCLAVQKPSLVSESKVARAARKASGVSPSCGGRVPLETRDEIRRLSKRLTNGDPSITRRICPYARHPSPHQHVFYCDISIFISNDHFLISLSGKHRPL